MLDISTVTNEGGRSLNEDAVGYSEVGKKSCFILCDGLGGHGMGDAASALVRDSFTEHFEKSKNIAYFLEDAFAKSQEKLLDAQEKQGISGKMRTTAVSMVTDGKTVYAGHVGDSRLYIFSGRDVMLRTLDHSMPQMLVLTGEIEEKDIRNHPERNILLRAMGTHWEKPMFDIMKPVPLSQCSAFLLCSDGFWELITEKKMCALLGKSRSADQWLSLMTKEVEKNGKRKNMDNYSAIAVINTDFKY